jgi:hypothetical protein
MSGLCGCSAWLCYPSLPLPHPPPPHSLHADLVVSAILPCVRPTRLAGLATCRTKKPSPPRSTCSRCLLGPCLCRSTVTTIFTLRTGSCTSECCTSTCMLLCLPSVCVCVSLSLSLSLALSLTLALSRARSSLSLFRSLSLSLSPACFLHFVSSVAHARLLRDHACLGCTA